MIHCDAALEWKFLVSVRPEIAALLTETLEAFIALFERRVRDRAFVESALREVFAGSCAHEGDLVDERAATSWFCRVLRRGVLECARHGDPRWHALEAAVRDLREPCAGVMSGPSRPCHATPPW